MAKRYQIDEQLFVSLIKYHVMDYRTPELEEQLRRDLQKKWNSVRLQDLYGRMHDESLTPEEREQARQEYLDERGIHPDFRW